METIIKRTFFKFFVPTLVSSIALAVISMTDLIVAGQLLGKEAFTAISLALPVTIFVQIIAAVFGGGAAIVLSNLLGQGDLQRCNRVFTTAIVSSVVIGVITAVMGTIFLEPLIVALGGKPGQMMDSASQYIGILMLGMPFMILAPILQTFLRNDSNPRYSMICVLTSGLWNLMVNIVLVLVFHMGIAGIALGTVTSQILSCILSGCKVFRKKSSFHLCSSGWSIKEVKAIVQPGLPAALIFFLQVILTIVINHTLMSTGGADAVAVYAVVKYLITFLYAFYDGVTGAIQPMLGIYHGEGEKENLRMTMKVGFRIMMVMSVGITLLLMVGAPIICAIFGVEQDMLAMTMTAIRIQAVFCITAGIIAFLGAYYRCTGHEKVAMVLAISNNLVFPVSLILLLSNFTTLGSNSVYLGLVLSDYGTLLVWYIYLWKYRKHGMSSILLLPTQNLENNQSYQVLIQDKYEDVAQISEKIAEFCEKHEVAVKKQYYINLCIEELVMNIIQLGFQKEQDNYIDIKLTVQQDGDVMLRIRDDATEFDPTQTEDLTLEQLSSGDHQEEHNELGIFLVKKVAKSYSYKRTVGFNNFLVVL